MYISEQNRWLHVICISKRDSLPNQLNVGDKYLIDRLTIWIDRDGDVYGFAYLDKNNSPEYIGQVKLSHFKGDY